MMRIKNINILCMAVFALALSSCRVELECDIYESSALSFDPVVVPVECISKSSAPVDGLNDELSLSTEGGDWSLPISLQEKDNLSFPFTETRAGDDKLHGTLSEFYTVAWNSNATTKFIPSYSRVYKNDGIWTTSQHYNWTDFDVKTFYAYGNNGDGQIVTSPGATKQRLEYTVNPDASKQSDIILGYYKGDGGKSPNGNPLATASVSFSHPLTAVEFKKGPMDGVTSIKQIQLENVYGHGIVEHTGNALFSWSARETPITVSQSSDAGLSIDDGGIIGQPFVLIPQGLASQPVVLRVKVTTTSGDVDLITKLDTGEWAAGKVNIYTLGFNGKEVFISGDKINDFQFVNCGIVSENIRAVICSNWYNGSGEIVAPCQILSVDESWTLHSDGYYYFNRQLLAGEYSGTILSEFSKPTPPAGYEEADLIVDVVVQAY